MASSKQPTSSSSASTPAFSAANLLTSNQQQATQMEEKVPDRAKFDDYESKTSEISDAKYRAFENWLISNGAEFPEVHLKAYSDNVRGVHTRTDVPAHTCIVSIPLKCLITDLMGRTQTEAGKAVFAPNVNAQLSAPTLIAVVLYILEMGRDANSFFKPYFDILPTDWNDFPVFWSEANLNSWLKGSPLVRDVKDRIRTMKADYDELRRVCGSHLFPYSFEEFLKVRTAVGSRNFGIIVDGEKRTSMVPFADMLNHYRPRETSWTFDSQRGHFTITTLTRLSAGQQVMDSYGRKDNSRFLLHYGFAVEVNREEDGRCQNEVALTLKVSGGREHYPSSASSCTSDTSSSSSSTSSRVVVTSSAVVSQPGGTSSPTVANGIHHPQIVHVDSTSTEDDDDDAAHHDHVDALGPMKRALLGAGKTKRQFKVSMNREDKGTTDAIAFARILAANEEELVQLVARCSQASVSLSSTKFLSPKNEAAALQIIADACRVQLSRYERSYEENVALLNSNALRPFTPRRSALVVITGEQEICSYWIYAAKTLGDALLNGREALIKVSTIVPGEPSFWARDCARHAAWLLSAWNDSQRGKRSF
jgi:hypothetical protein